MGRSVALKTATGQYKNFQMIQTLLRDQDSIQRTVWYKK